MDPPRSSDSSSAAPCFKQCPEDFEVEELPLYPLEGAGDHTFLFVEKVGRPTTSVASDLARALDVPITAVGFAGRKDSAAVTRQWFSVEHASPDRVAALELHDARVLEVGRHRNKLRLGHLLGNEFRIVVRGVADGELAEVAERLRRIEREGLPNRFGPQRFGAHGDNGEVGRALLLGDHEQAVARLGGSPREGDFGAVLRARELFDEGRFDEAARTFPRGYELAGRLARAMARERGRARRALRSLRRREQAFFVSAWQACAFHAVLEARSHEPDTLLEGDVAWDHAARHAVPTFGTEEERERALAHELSPAGPLFGPRLKLADGRAGAIERAVLEAQGVGRALEDRAAFAGLRGARRPLRVRPTRAAVRALGANDLELRFRLPEGAFATTLLDELGRGRWEDASLATGTAPREDPPGAAPRSGEGSVSS